MHSSYLAIDVLFNIILNINEDKSGKAATDSTLSRKLSYNKLRTEIMMWCTTPHSMFIQHVL